MKIPELNTKLQKLFPKQKKHQSDALRLLLLDLSSYFVNEGDNREYNVLEPPLGLLTLNTHINKKFEDKVNSKILKSFIDFNSLEELLNHVEEFEPHLIGIRAMTFYSGFFHDTIKFLRENDIKSPIIVGGPYPTASYVDIIKDRNIDLAVIAEGEITLGDIIQRMLNNNYLLPTKNELANINGIAYYSDQAENRMVDVTAAIPITKNFDKIMNIEI